MTIEVLVIDTNLKEGNSLPAYMDTVYTLIKTLGICAVQC